MKPGVIKLFLSGCSVKRSYGLFHLVTNLSFAGLSVPFLYLVTEGSVFNNVVVIRPPDFFLSQDSPLFSEGLFTVSCFLLFFLSIYSAFFVAERMVELAKLILTYVVGGFYMSFWFFGGNLYANGTSLPLLIMLLVVITFPSKQKLLNETVVPDMRPIQFMCLGVVAMFFASGLSKLSVLGFAWASAENIQNILLYRYLFVDIEVSRWLANSPVACGIIGWAVLIFELGGGLVLFFLNRGSLIYGAGAVTFLSGTWLLLGIDEFIALFLPFTLVFFLPGHSVSDWRRIFLMESRISERK